jgi:hypothetical protein
VYHAFEDPATSAIRGWGVAEACDQLGWGLDDDNDTVRRGSPLIVLVVVVALALPVRLGAGRRRIRIAGRGYKAGRFTYVGNAALPPPPNTNADTFLKP